MPFINVKTNAKLSDTQKLAVENALSDAISLIPGKSDRYLMLAVEDGLSMTVTRSRLPPWSRSRSSVPRQSPRMRS